MAFPARKRVRLTAPGIRALALPAGKTDWIYWDADLPGFGLRLRAGGSRMWVVQYDIGRKGRRMTLGSTAVLEPGKARETAKSIFAAVRLGKDPAGDKEALRNAPSAITFAEEMERFLRFQQQRLKPRSLLEIDRHLRIHGKPLHRIELAKIDRRAIATQLTGIAETSGPVAANRTRATWSSFFTWAAKEGLIDVNPAAYTNKQAEQSRERVLRNDELRAIWQALPEGDYGDIVRLLALTGQRREEIGSLRWSEVDFDRGIIALPPSRTKNSREHIVPMSAPVRAILEARPKFHGRDLVFGIGEGGFSGWSRCKERLDEAAKIEAWTIHDLRRTMATKMAEELGQRPHIIEAALNHVGGHKSGVHGIYNRSQYLAEKKQALALWADHVLALVEGKESNIVSLRTA
jgi:integrase